MIKWTTLFFITLWLASIPLNSFSQYQYIQRLSYSDHVFKSFRNNILYLDRAGVYWDSRSTRPSQRRKFTFKGLKLALYKVKRNDTLENIAQRTSLTTDTLISINTLASRFSLKPGHVIVIPNLNGRLDIISKESSVHDISNKYQLSPDLIYYVNHMRNDIVYQGNKVFIPYKGLSKDEKAYFRSDVFLMPVSGRISSGFGIRKDPFKQRHTFHGGLDIAARHGKPVFASQDGQVLFARNAGGYGNLIILAHKYGYSTLYGHLSSIYVKVGTKVRKGQFIGRVGQTGKCTGPHLHFEIRRYNKVKNPVPLTHSVRQNSFFTVK